MLRFSIPIAAKTTSDVLKSRPDTSSRGHLHTGDTDPDRVSESPSASSKITSFIVNQPSTQLSDPCITPDSSSFNSSYSGTKQEVQNGSRFDTILRIAAEY